MAIIYLNNKIAGVRDQWEVRCETLAIIGILEHDGLACNESVMLVPWWHVAQ